MTPDTPSQRVDISIVGLGIVVGLQVTKEAEFALRDAEEVLYLDSGFGATEYLTSVCKRLTDLRPLAYREGESRHAAYDQMSAAVLESALHHPPVVFAVYGHPQIYVYPTEQIVAASACLGLTVKVIPGISSLDTMIIDLGIDPGLDGLQMYEATDLLARGRPLQSDVPCLIWQVGVVGTRLYSERRSLPERFVPLTQHLAKFYPREHSVRIVCSTDHPLIRSDITECALGELPSRLPEVSPVASLYIPPTHARPLSDEMAGTIDSLQYLHSVSK